MVQRQTIKTASMVACSVRCSLSRYQANQRKLRALTTYICTTLGLDNCELSLSLVGGRAIRTLNSNYRGKDRSTDVLSFPQQVWDKRPRAIRRGAGFTTKQNKSSRSMHGQLPLTLGDVVISLPDAERNAAAIGQSLDKEVCFLLVHGILHLCGYDHIQAKDERQMFKEQRYLTKQLATPNLAKLWQDCVARKQPGSGRVAHLRGARS